MPTLSTSAHSGAKRSALVVNMVIHGLYVVSLPVWYFLSMFSVMLFDSPGSENYWPALVFYYALKSYPVMVLVAIVIVWMSYRKGFYNRTYIITAFPLIVILICAGLLFGFGE